MNAAYCTCLCVRSTFDSPPPPLRPLLPTMPHNKRPCVLDKRLTPPPLPGAPPPPLLPTDNAAQSKPMTFLTHPLTFSSPCPTLVYPHVVFTTTQKAVQLYLCDWGFNTAAQRARGEANPRVRLVGKDDIGGALSSPVS